MYNILGLVAVSIRVIKARPHNRIICTNCAKNSKFTSSKVHTSGVFTEKIRATRVAWSRDNFLSADWLNCDRNAEEWTNGSGSSTINSYGMRLS